MHSYLSVTSSASIFILSCVLILTPSILLTEIQLSHNFLFLTLSGESTSIRDSQTIEVLLSVLLIIRIVSEHSRSQILMPQDKAKPLVQRNLSVNASCCDISKQNVTPWQILYCTTGCITIYVMFQENLNTNTQVWNGLGNRNDCPQRGVT